MYSLNKNITEMIKKKSAMRIDNQTKKPKKTKMSSLTRALMKKHTEMIENMTARDHIEYVDICKTIKKIAKGRYPEAQIRDEMRETSETSKSLKKVRRTHSLGKNLIITPLDKQDEEIQEQNHIMARIE